MQIKIFSSRFFLIVIFSFLFVFLSFTIVYAGQNKGEIISLTPDGDVYINLGLNDGISEGDLIEIYDGGELILTLQVKDVYQEISKLHPPKRKDLYKLRVGLQARPYLKEVSISAIEGKLITFDLVEESGFIDLGAFSGIEEGMDFEVLKEGNVVATLKVTRVFNKISKVVVIEKEPKVKILTGLKVRLKTVKKKIPVGRLKRFMRKILDKFSGEARSIFTNYYVSGNKAQSYYPKRYFSYREEVDLKYTDTLERGTDLEGLLSLRITDDFYVDAEGVSVENAYFDCKDKNLNVRIGEFFGNFTNYSLSTPLKGGKINFGDDNIFGALNFLGVFGTNKSKWEYLWERIPSRNYAQRVGGFRITQDIFSKNHTLGFGFVDTWDDKNSSGAPNAVTQKNRVFNIDFESKPVEDVKINTEWATSLKRYEQKPGNIEYKNDYAFKIDADIDTELPFLIGEWNFRNKYEMVGANFQALSGVTSVDREEFHTQISGKYLDKVSWKGGYRYYHDNLKKLLSKTTNYYRYDASTSFRALEMLFPDFELSYEWDMRTQTTSDSSVDENIITHTFGAYNKTGVYSYGADYSLMNKIDDENPDSDRKKHIFNINVKSNYKLGKMRLMPTISYEFERDRQETTGDLDLYQRLRLGANVYIGKYTSLNLYYTCSHIDYCVGESDSIKNFIDVKFRTYLFNTPDNILEISFKQNDYIREGEPDESYTDNIFECQYTFRF